MLNDILQDSSGKLSRGELEGILSSLLKAEKISGKKSKELMNDIFREMDANCDGKISLPEFLAAANASELILKILVTAADSELKAEKVRAKGQRRTRSKSKKRGGK